MAQSISPGILSPSSPGRPSETPLMKPKEQEAMSLLKVGPFPSRCLQKPDDEGGEIAWNEKGRTKLAQIFVSYGDHINSMAFQYIEDDKLVISPIYGSRNLDGTSFVAIMLPNDEYITGVSGSYGVKDYRIGKVVKTLTIETNAATYGPFGRIGTVDENFNLSFGPEDQFGGFHGTSSSDFVTSIGVYVKPIDNVATLSKRTELRVE